jgi:hypothetical protein
VKVACEYEPGAIGRRQREQHELGVLRHPVPIMGADSARPSLVHMTAQRELRAPYALIERVPTR